ncbi:DUF1272 domain-containing protein [uncultured Caulobacter sp.]|jgi:uncharacterized protein|uniref:DUF1272 domain-containing protein n=1 Tax=uncultured Caulobacter sp. TaxID=158749 RepID=UPI00261F9FD5|nr:DUF1272 domain-containing protein [uncultured Caulobacter sp.]
MLELRPNCECCDADLPPASVAARICTFEHTFCADCADLRFEGACPDCGGGLAPRPIRPESQLHRFPASLRRVVRAHRPPSPRREPERPTGWL